MAHITLYQGGQPSSGEIVTSDKVYGLRPYKMACQHELGQNYGDLEHNGSRDSHFCSHQVPSFDIQLSLRGLRSPLHADV